MFILGLTFTLLSCTAGVTVKDYLKNDVILFGGDYTQLFMIIDDNEYACIPVPTIDIELYSYPKNPI